MKKKKKIDGGGCKLELEVGVRVGGLGVGVDKGMS